MSSRIARYGFGGRDERIRAPRTDPPVAGPCGQGDSGHDGTKPRTGLPPAARAFFDWVVVVGVALFVAIMVRTFLLAHFVVDGDSMLSTLHTGDRVFVNKLSYRLHDPNRGDVVVLHELDGGQRTRPDQARDRPRGRVDRDPRLQVYIDEDPNDGGAVPAKRLVEPYLDPTVVAGTSWCEFPRRSSPTTACS